MHQANNILMFFLKRDYLVGSSFLTSKFFLVFKELYFLSEATLKNYAYLTQKMSTFIKTLSINIESKSLKLFLMYQGLQKQWPQKVCWPYIYFYLFFMYFIKILYFLFQIIKFSTKSGILTAELDEGKIGKIFNTRLNFKMIILNQIQ